MWTFLKTERVSSSLLEHARKPSETVLLRGIRVVPSVRYWCFVGAYTSPVAKAVKPGASLNDLGNAAARTNMEIAGLRAVSPGIERRMDGKTLHRGSFSLIEDRVRDLASGRA